MFTTRKRGRTAAVFGAVAGLLLSTAAAASADPSPTIDPNAEGSITITKLVQPDVGGPEAPGNQMTLPENAQPISGVTFKVELVTGFDFNGDNTIADDEKFFLTTAEGWQNAGKVTPAMLDGGHGKVEKGVVAGPQPTDFNGQIKFGGLLPGLYLVTEVSTADAQIEDELISASGDAVVPSSKPFLVTLPMTDPAEHNEWMYDVFVYPKNERVSLEKSVEDAENTLLEEEITYRVSMDVPEGTESFVITDQLDERLQYVPGSVRFPGVTGTPVYDDQSHTLTVTFAATPGQTLPAGEIAFTFRAKVMQVGEIENRAIYEMVVNGVPVKGGSNEVITKWGGHDVAKVNQDGAYLEGALFSLYQVRFDVNGNEIVGLIQQNIESGPDGKVKVDGLRYSLWADGAPIVDTNNNGDVTDEAGYVFYRLIETKAPTDYELQATPIDFEVTGPSDRDNTNPDSRTNGIDLEIVNVRHNAGFDLPEVGGNRAVLPIVAAVIAAGGVVWLIRSRREQQV